MMKTGWKKTRPGVEWKDGKLYLFRRDRITVLRSWPDLAAWRKTKKKPVWRQVRPEGPLTELNVTETEVADEWSALRAKWIREGLRPGSAAALPYHPIRVGKRLSAPFPLTPANRFRMPCWSYAWFLFARTFPAEVRQAVRPFQSRTWHLLSLMARCPGSLDLVQGNPALAYALASNWVFHRPAVKQPLRSARMLIRKRQREILGWLGFPATETARKIVSRLRSSSLSILNLLRLRRALSKPKTARFLGHLRYLSEDLLCLADDQILNAHIAPSFYLELCAVPSELQDGTFWNVRETLAMAEILQPGRPRPVFRSLDHLAELHEAMIQEMNHLTNIEQRNAAFPSPPVPGTAEIIPIENLRELWTEGCEMKNCAASYLTAVISNRTYFYRVIAPERATLAITQTRAGWSLQEVRTVRNGPVADETVCDIRAWLAECNFS